MLAASDTQAFKKIIIIGPAYPLRGGPAVFNENLALHCLNSGIPTELVSYRFQYPKILFPGSSQLNASAPPKDSIKRSALIHTLNPWSWWKTARYIKNQKPDLVLIRFWLPFFAPALGTIARMLRKHTTVLALTDNVVPHEKRPGDRSLTTYFLNSCSGFLTMSDRVYLELKNWPVHKPIVQTRHPLYETYGPALSRSQARKKLNINSDAEVVLFFGLIRAYKGLDLLIEAFNRSAAENPRLVLLIAGECYENAQWYQNLISKSAFHNRIVWHNRFIDDAEIPLYFSAANLSAQTYRNATNSGVSMLAYFYRVPLLVTATGGLQSIVPHEKAGFCVPVNVLSIAEHLDRYFKEGLETQFKTALEFERQKYSWNQFLGSLQELYKMVTGSLKPELFVENK